MWETFLDPKENRGSIFQSEDSSNLLSHYVNPFSLSISCSLVPPDIAELTFFLKTVLNQLERLLIRYP